MESVLSSLLLSVYQPSVLMVKSSGLEEFSRYKALSTSKVVPDPFRCVQCGICSYNCPLGIDVRRHSWEGKAIVDSRCITCAECINRCPRGTLRFESITYKPNGS